MKVTVLWSGGYDSTALIYHHLERGDEVELLSVSLDNNPAQVDSESIARRWILELLQREFGRPLPHTEAKWPVLAGPAPWVLSQPPLWLSAAAYNASSDTVSAGWVKGDDVWHLKADLASLMASLNRFRERPLELLTPFEWSSKEDLLPYYFRRPLVFQALSSSERGHPWAAAGEDDPKCRELRRLAEMLRAKGDRSLWGPGSDPGSSKPDESRALLEKADALAREAEALRAKAAAAAPAAAQAVVRSP